MDNIALVSRVLSIMTVLGQGFLIIGLIVFVAARRDLGSRFRDFLWRRATVLSLLVVLVAILGSLFYSEVAGYNPCELCWYQRVAMYPLLALLAISLFRDDRAALDYSLALAVIGLMFSLYHNYLFFGNSALGLCTADGSGTSCLIQYVTEFNYVTIPVMALTAFLLLIFFLVIGRRRVK